MRMTSLPACFLHVAVLQAVLWETTLGSVLPRPNYRMDRPTTQILSLSKNYSDESVVIVTSSELPKQIPPPPTPTRSHGVTPQYDNSRWDAKPGQNKVRGKRVRRYFPVRYNSLESAMAFRKVV